jgi:Zn-finger nucleic acid-binding protein
MELTCPKCHGAMRTYERNGVHVDQCADCRGIFLDRGELDRLVDAEKAWHGGPEPSREPHRGSGSDLGSVVSDVFSSVRGSKHSNSGYPRKKKESFLGDLFG